METVQKRTIFDIFGDGTNSSELDKNEKSLPGIMGEPPHPESQPIEKGRDNPESGEPESDVTASTMAAAVKDYQIVPETSKSVSFSFSPVKPETSTDHYSSKKSNDEGDFANMGKTDFSDLTKDAESFADVALALAAALERDEIHWSGTAKILSVLLGEHVHKLKEFAAKM